MNLNDKPFPASALIWLACAIIWSCIAVVEFHLIYVVAAVASLVVGAYTIVKYRRKQDKK
jgi:predicted membrane protein